jgi:hypothetical protein
MQLEKIEQGLDPAPNDATLQIDMVYATPRNRLILDRDGCGFFAGLSSQDLDRGSIRLRVASRLDLALRTLSDLAALVTEK